MLRLHERMAGGLYPNCRKMAEELEVSAKTIQRDINFMRDQLALPIYYDDLRVGFGYTRPVNSFPDGSLSAEETRRRRTARNAGANFPESFPLDALGKGSRVVRIHFDSKAAPNILGCVWHSSQKTTRLPQGNVELTFRLGNLAGLERWVLGWGVHARVMEPDRLHKRVVRIARNIVKRG